MSPDKNVAGKDPATGFRTIGEGAVREEGDVATDFARNENVAGVTWLRRP